MQVLRVENHGGFGPYFLRHGKRPAWNTEDFNSMNHPTPEDDGYLWQWCDLPSAEQQQYSFGFVDARQLTQWFYNDAWVTALRVAGYMCVTYEASEYFLGKRQVVFKKSSAQRLGVREILYPGLYPHWA